MFSVLGIGASGLATENDVLTAVAANIANLNTPGYGSQQPELASGVSTTVRPGGATLLGQALNGGLSVNAGAMLVGNTPEFSSVVEPTQHATNLAIRGNGFFIVSTPNGLAFTRAGLFEIDAGGELVLPGGAKLYPPIYLPLGEAFRISADGVVTASGPTGSKVVGQIKLALIPNPAGLVSLGNNLYGLSANSGTPIVGNPGQNGTGLLQPSAVNQSGTSLAQSLVNLIQAETAYSANAKVISVDQQVIQSTTNLQV
ncbi:MAG: flagellar hook-basal body complex protein [Firmicutes bacterium]|nr:flagellar hook-basal body complex protein [Bacillota bacterium]